MRGFKQIIQNIIENPGIFETPCYVYIVEEVIKNYTDLKECLGTDLIGSFKANSCVELLTRCNHVMGNGVEVASLKELNDVIGTSGEIFLNNPSCGQREIRAALASKATIVADNLQQIEKLSEFMSKTEIKPIILRLNNSLLNQFSSRDVAFRPDHFGMDWETICKAIRMIHELGLGLRGLHIFNGSYSFREKAELSLLPIRKIISEVETRYGDAISLVNLGGGFSEKWRDEGIDFTSYRKHLSRLPSHIDFVHEAGRGVFGSAGYYLTRMLNDKKIDGKAFGICDGGITHNFLLAKTENVFKRYKTPRIHSAVSETKLLSDEMLLVGPSCSKDDIFGLIPAGNPKPGKGDYFIFDYCGAYNYSYSVSRFLSLPDAKQYII
ncbi:diaminopimelate decarboxylase [Desulfosalsimonas propionicica]|uniref:Diaminopimelate decarboxylase n=1 Tax=Desulfosalsimonas propionicica TaxID=332175 RepID=A0A7W0C9Y3_9BACT|nr:PLP-dependent decarboxylase [Desulfosalsimonas propionicica]MBA2881880.1 diaminopimelate decarboxylase [Desulfosalsimonas propionicica]